MKEMLGFIMVMIVIAVFIPITQELLPSMGDTMGPSVVMMVSSIVVIILVSAIYMYFNSTMGEDRHASIQ
jgi:uncharacterized membrane protein YczE